MHFVCLVVHCTVADWGSAPNYMQNILFILLNALISRDILTFSTRDSGLEYEGRLCFAQCNIYAQCKSTRTQQWRKLNAIQSAYQIQPTRFDCLSFFFLFSLTMNSLGRVARLSTSIWRHCAGFVLSAHISKYATTSHESVCVRCVVCI